MSQHPDDPNDVSRRHAGAGPSGAGPTDLVAMGVVHPHGLRGELKVVLHNPASSFDWKGASVVLRPRGPAGGAPRSFRVGRFRRTGPLAMIVLDGVGDRTAAEALDGHEVSVPRGALPPPEEDEVYLGDLVGLVVTTEGQRVGVVREIRVYPSASCAVVALDHALDASLGVGTGGGELEIPIHAPYVVEVDLREHALRVALLEDLAVTPREPA